MGLRLGIDTGGTFTDAAILDSENRILAHAKALTTHYDLSQGIESALSSLPSSHLGDIQLVGLSTTLTTNAVVEGRGMPVCVLLAGFNHKQVARSRLRELIGDDPVVLLSGKHDPQGMETEALDENAAIQAIQTYRDQVSAFAISGMFGVRNPSHEVRLRELVASHADKPVSCGHELSSGLDAPRRAVTAAVNARIIPFIRELIDSVSAILIQMHINAPLMLVKGDGSLINRATALERPVETIMSGPAASVIGAAFLSGSDNALVADMGGTTTDIAVVTDGRPNVNPRGAIVGQWPLMVEALEVHAIGLGGDSEVRFGGGLGIAIGPRRVVPLSLLVSQHPDVLGRLERQLSASANSRHLKFFLRHHQSEVLLSRLSPEQRSAWEMLDEGPVELDAIMEKDRRAARCLSALARQGLVIYSGFTPADAAHVLGGSSHWSSDGAVLAAKIWMAQMKQVYGYGRWVHGDAEAACREVIEKLTRIICGKLIEASIPRRFDPLSKSTLQFANQLTSLLLGRQDNERELFDIAFLGNHQLVAVGAPAGTFYPRVAETLQSRLAVPKYAEVANAIGAVMGSVIQKSEVTVTQPTEGGFRVYVEDGPRDFVKLDDAVSFAERIAEQTAVHNARSAGAVHIETTLLRQDNQVDDPIDGSVFFDSKISAIASGRPQLRE